MNKHGSEAKRLSAEEMQEYARRLQRMARESRKDMGEGVVPPVRGMRVEEMDLTGEYGDEEAGLQEARAKKLQQIVDAIARIGEGTYGKCVECMASIPKARLDALPHAPLCISCQHAAENEKQAGDGGQRLDYGRLLGNTPSEDVMPDSELVGLWVPNEA